MMRSAAEKKELDVERVPQRWLVLRRLVFLLILICFPTFAFSDVKREVQVSIPGQWKRSATDFDGAWFFQNTRSSKNEVVAVRFHEFSEPSKLKPENFVSAKSMLSRDREEFLRNFAINRYTIHHMDSAPSPWPEFLGVITIEASYRGIRGQEVQVVERQYYARTKFIQVMYSEESPGLGDRARIGYLLDNFKPRLASKSRADYLLEWLRGAEAHAANEVLGGGGTRRETTGNSNSGAAEQDIAPQEVKGASNIKDLCEMVPEAERWSSSDPPITGGELYETCKGVLNEVAESVTKAVSETYTSAKETVATAWENATVDNVKSYVKSAADKVVSTASGIYNDPGYYAQKAGASLIAGAESIKSSGSVLKHLASGIWNAVNEADPPGGCYKEKIQAKMFCEIVPNLVKTLGPMKVISLAKKGVSGPMKATVAQVAKASREKNGLGQKLASKVKEGLQEGAGSATAVAKEGREVANAAAGAQGGAAAGAAGSAKSVASNESRSQGRSGVPNAGVRPGVVDDYLKAVEAGDGVKGSASMKAVLSKAQNLTDAERIAASRAMLGKKGITLDAEKEKKIIELHRIAEGKSYDELKKPEIRAKFEGLRKEVGLSHQDAESLMKNGITGGRPDGGINIGQIERRLDGDKVSAMRNPLEAQRAARDGNIAEAQAAYRQFASRSPSREGKVKNLIDAGDVGEAASALISHSNGRRGSDAARKDLQYFIKYTQDERKKMEVERDNRSITNKGKASDQYYADRERKLRAAEKQFKEELEALD